MNVPMVLLLVAPMFFGGYFVKDITTRKIAPIPTPIISTQITPSNTILPTDTLTPSPTSKPVAKEGCSSVNQRILKQYGNMRPADNWLIANRLDCHYVLQKEVGLPQSNTNIQDTFDARNAQNQTNTQNSNQDNCQDQINKYTVCISEYTVNMAKYNTCLSDSAAGRTYMFCTKPNNFCGLKPFCNY